jgi:hypothetical protein
MLEDHAVIALRRLIGVGDYFFEEKMISDTGAQVPTPLPDQPGYSL